MSEIKLLYYIHYKGGSNGCNKKTSNGWNKVEIITLVYNGNNEVNSNQIE